MSASHTPGEWLIQSTKRSPCRIVAANDHDNALALVYLTCPKTKKRTPEMLANARLIEAAPVMVAALEAFLYQVDQHGIGTIPSGIHEAAAHARAVVAKVKGRS